ncbi:MAG: hypothetical protein H6849_00320 [Alphaproteobacteria bacterium]|nr:MAG: hypothetical protein H6849_00320 [Alphaproteobacteria bacterium]
MHDFRTIAIFGTKILLLGAACALAAFMVLWPYFCPSSRYEVTEITHGSLDPNDQATVIGTFVEDNATTSSVSSNTEHPSTEPESDLEEGEMLFQGKTQLILAPRS